MHAMYKCINVNISMYRIRIRRSATLAKIILERQDAWIKDRHCMDLFSRIIITFTITNVSIQQLIIII